MIGRLLQMVYGVYQQTKYFTFLWSEEPIWIGAVLSYPVFHQEDHFSWLIDFHRAKALLDIV